MLASFVLHLKNKDNFNTGYLPKEKILDAVNETLRKRNSPK